jgi:hypothetical protein
MHRTAAKGVRDGYRCDLQTVRLPRLREAQDGEVLPQARRPRARDVVLPLLGHQRTRPFGTGPAGRFASQSAARLPLPALMALVREHSDRKGTRDSGQR